MTDTTTPPAACWRCGGSIDAADNYCRHCGKGQGSHIPWYYGYFGIAFLTVAAMGPFSLWLVWRSPRLSRTAKYIYAACIIGFTLFAAMKVIEIYRTAMAAITGQLPALQQLQ